MSFPEARYVHDTVLVGWSLYVLVFFPGGAWRQGRQRRVELPHGTVVCLLFLSI